MTLRKLVLLPSFFILSYVMTISDSNNRGIVIRITNMEGYNKRDRKS